MASSVTRKADFMIFTVEGEFSIFSIAEDFQIFSNALAEVPENILVDLSQVSEMDTSAVQLLLWLKKQCGDSSHITVDVRSGSSAEHLLKLYRLPETQLGKLVSTGQG